jgi:integrase
VKQNGKPNSKLVLVNGEPVSSKGGTFYLDWRENGKHRTQSAGTTPRETLDAWMLRTGIQAGETEAPEEAAGSDLRLTIDGAIKDYLVDVRATTGDRTCKVYGRELQWFRERTNKRYVSELDRSDAVQMFALGREERRDGRPHNQKTINKRVIIMLNAMRSRDATITMNKGDWPKTIDKKAEIYPPEELKPFFAACDPEELLVFQIFLFTGFRERETATLAWTDIQWKEGKLAVSAKPELGFRPKSYEERSVPVPMALIKALRERQRTSTSRLVFPTQQQHPTKPQCTGDKPDNHMLEQCKEVAFLAGLNCGHCQGEYAVYILNKGVQQKGEAGLQMRYLPALREFARMRYLLNVLNQALAEIMKRGASCSLPGSPAIDGQVIQVHRGSARSSQSIQLKLGLHHPGLPTQRER